MRKCVQLSKRKNDPEVREVVMWLFRCLVVFDNFFFVFVYFFGVRVYEFRLLFHSPSSEAIDTCQEGARARLLAHGRLGGNTHNGVYSSLVLGWYRVITGCFDICRVLQGFPLLSGSTHGFLGCPDTLFMVVLNTDATQAVWTAGLRSLVS